MTTHPNKNWPPERKLKAGILSIIVLLLLVLVFHLPGVFLPVGLAFLLAYILEPIIAFMQRHHTPRVFMVLLVYFLFILTVTITGILLVPPLVSQGSDLYRFLKEKGELYGLTENSYQMDDADKKNEEGLWSRIFGEKETDADENRVKEEGENLQQSEGAAREEMSEEILGISESELTEEIDQWMEQNSPMIKEQIPELIVSGSRAILTSAGNTAMMFIQFLLTLFYAFFFMLHFHEIPLFLTRWIPPAHRREAAELGKEIDEVVAGFFRGRLVVCLISSVVACIGLLLSGVDYWLLLGLSAGFLGIIPFFGVAVTLIPCLLIAITSDQTAFAVIGVLVTFGIVQWIVEPIIGPFVISSSVRMHPVTVTVAFMTGGALFGVLGLLLAIPACGILKILAQHYLVPTISEVWNGDGSA